MEPEMLALTAFTSFVLVAGGLRPLIAFMHSRAILDVPVERSSHAKPTPKGAGLIVVPVVILCWGVFDGIASPATDRTLVLVISGASIVLMLLSWLDDLRHMSPLVRLVLHILCAGVGIFVLPDTKLLLQGYAPLIIDRLVMLLLWVWFINLFNFMDGIDGISATETIVIGVGMLIVAASPVDSSYLAAALIGALSGFLLSNWHPARIFLGDAGSAPLGYLLGWLLITFACAGYWVPALILPGYYFADSGLTLLKRMFRRQRFWQAHREHAFQHAAVNVGHPRVCVLVGVAGVLLIVLAVTAVAYPRESLIAAIVLSIACFGLLMFLGREK